jgi:predicted branched-subunit amino acid permease
VLFADQVAKGASLIAAAFAISLTGVRLLPMTLSIMPLLTDEKPSRLKRILAVHFVAVTAWFEGLRQLPHVPRHLRLSYFVGLGASMLIATLIGTFAGYFIAGRVPTPVSATLLLTTPVYFFISLLMAARVRADWIAIGLGALIGPPVYWLVPGFDLMIAGLLGGTIAFLVGRRGSKPGPVVARGEKL